MKPDFTSHLVSSSDWLARSQARLLWARRHDFAPGQSHFAPQIAVYALWLMREGGARIEWPGASFCVERGQGFWGAPCRERRVVALEHGARWLSVGLRLDSVERGDALRHLSPGPFSPDDEARLQLEPLLDFAFAASDWPGAGGVLAREGATRSLAGWAWHHLGAMPVEEEQNLPWLRRTLEHIEREPGVGVGELARASHFSPSQFRRLFARQMGRSPRDFLLERRLELARRLIESDNGTVGETAARCGWNSAAQFSSDFKRAFGISPLAWRRAVREGI